MKKKVVKPSWLNTYHREIGRCGMILILGICIGLSIAPDYHDKYLHESDLVTHYVKIMHDTHEQDLEISNYSEQLWINETIKYNCIKSDYDNMQQYAWKLEHKLRRNHIK